jgi:hypothetical protein
MIRELSAIVLVAAIASAIPTNDVTPEDTLVEYDVDSRRHDYEHARKHIQTLMETGKTDKECRDLATASKKAVEDDVKADQKILDALPDGSDCKKEGQGLVSSSQSSLTKAKSDKDDAKKKLDKTKAANVDFGSFPYNQLTPGQCGTFFNHAAYKNAKSALDKAQTAYNKADGAQQAAQAAYDQAVAAASNAKMECLCRAKKAYDHGWKEVKKTTPKAGVDWKTAHDIICVLDGTPVSKCKVPAQPTVKKPKLDPEAAKMNSATCKGGMVVFLPQSCGTVGYETNPGTLLVGSKFMSKVMGVCGTHTNQMVSLGECVTWRYYNGKIPYGWSGQRTNPVMGLVSLQHDTHLTATQRTDNGGVGLSKTNADFGMALAPSSELQLFDHSTFRYTKRISGVPTQPNSANGGEYRMCLAKDGTVTYSWRKSAGATRMYPWKKDVYTAQKKATGPMWVDVLTWEEGGIMALNVTDKPSWNNDAIWYPNRL